MKLFEPRRPGGPEAAQLRQHLMACHPGAQMPWFASGWIDQLDLVKLEGLHEVLHGQGEDHEEQQRPAEVVELEPTVCRRTKCAERTTRPDGLCERHGAAYDSFARRRSA